MRVCLHNIIHSFVFGPKRDDESASSGLIETNDDDGLARAINTARVTATTVTRGIFSLAEGNVREKKKRVIIVYNL